MPTEQTIRHLVRDHRDRRLPSLRKRRDYFEGRTTQGLPARLLDTPHEIVLENDIAWRIHTMVDFLLGRPVAIRATGPRREDVERALDEIIESSGGIALLQDASTLAHVHGAVHFLLRHDDSPLGIRIDLVDPLHAIPVPNKDALLIDARRTDPGRDPVDVLEVIEPHRHRRYEGDALVHDGPGLLGGVDPVVLLRNLSKPLSDDGLSDVDPLVDLQDELNTRLSDRANRVTMQAFRMLLAKGIEGPESLPVAPGTVWRTWNPDADVRTIGGDAHAPSEERHIQDVREALDKVSAIPPLAGGVVQGRIGNLSSANALRVTLIGALARTARKRFTYGSALRELCARILDALDRTHVLHTTPEDRDLRLDWPDPLPVDDHDRALAALSKLELGVDPQRLVEELGYGDRDQGIE